MAAVITFDDGYRDNYVYALPILRKYSVPATFFLTTGHIGLGKLFWWDIVGYLVHYTRATHLKLEALGGYRLESAFDRRRATLVIWDKLRHFPENRKNDLIENLARVSRVDIPADLGRQLILSWEEVREMSRDGAHFGAHSVTHPVLTNLPPEQAKSEICQSKDDIERKVRKEVNFFSYPSGCFNDEIVDIVKQAGFVAAVAADPSWINYKSDLYRLGRIEMTQDANRSAARFCGLWQDLRTVSRRGSK
jgi:peptidoglycan/xylan/chitin deacetylase (PgdA/CDA1 family)